MFPTSEPEPQPSAGVQIRAFAPGRWLDIPRFPAHQRDHSALMTEKGVADARRLANDDVETAALARRDGVTESVMSAAHKSTSWKHVPMPWLAATGRTLSN